MNDTGHQFLPAYLRFSASGCCCDVDNLIAQALDPATDLYMFNNVDRFRAKGVEFEWKGKHPGGMMARARVTPGNGLKTLLPGGSIDC